MASSSNKKHDVFISFRGEDTRTGFTSHLHSALDRHKIDTYIDYKLVKGEDVWTKLSQAIECSLMSVVVFSRDYASSTWCLKELAKIMECRRWHGQVVIPSFYETEPSDVRWQKGSYERAFAKHERDLRNDRSAQDKLSKWKAALTEAANLSGWDSSTHRDESELIQNIVNDVLQKLYLRYPNELEGLVGNDKAFGDIASLLEKFQVIGIWGMGGIGKTTIAKAMFAKHFPQYDSSCFLANVREESTKLGLTYCREKLLFDILKEKIHSPNVVGSTFVKRRIKSKKVFIVLDDVDSLEQLESLCGERGDLGPDSRLIITTRDKQLLIGRVDKIFVLEKWNFKESLTLFSLNAFKKEHPEKEYEHLSGRAVGYADGVPLALKVLGSYLYGRSSEFWESALRKLKEYPNETIQSVLKVSYDGLDQSEKDIFLDIAFFFKEEDKDYVTRILDASGFYAALGIDVLVNKALITISSSNRIQMHDLLQEMGLDIVHEECRGDPGKHSRLRDVEQVCDVLKNKEGTDKVKGITLDLSQIEDLNLRVDTFSMMINLRFIRFHLPLGRRSGSVLHPGVLNPFSEKLRYFEWHGYPLNSLPQNFCAKLLVEIRMQHSNVKELWQGMQGLVNLELIDLSECNQLTKLPDLSKASKLKWVYLSGCENLSVVHPSILSLDTLVTLILDRCKKLMSLKSEKHLPALERISVDGCSCLKEFSVSSDLIESLDLSNTGIQILHSSIGRLHKLVWLNLEGLRLKTLPDELSSLKSLQELRISKCMLVINKQKLHVICDGLQSLKILHLKDCKNLSELPDNIKVLSQLNELRLDGSNVKRLPASIKHLQKLQILSLQNCRKLRFLPELPSSIKEFHVDNCTSLVTVSTLMSFAAGMEGENKVISFKNCMKLDGRSLECIMESALLTLISAVLRSLFSSVEVCLAGSRVPTLFTYRKMGSSITIKHPMDSALLGIIYCVILSPSREMKQHGGAKLQCQCYLADGKKVGYNSTWHYNAITDLNSDHIYVWYDPFHCRSIEGHVYKLVRYEFSATTDNGDGLSVKECGVHLMRVSDLYTFVRKQQLDLGTEWGGLEGNLNLVMSVIRNYPKEESRLLFALTNGLELEVSLKLEFESHRRAILALIGKESNDVGTQIHYQEEDASEKCSCSSDCIAGPKAPVPLSHKRKLAPNEKAFQTQLALELLEGSFEGRKPKTSKSSSTTRDAASRSLPSPPKPKRTSLPAKKTPPHSKKVSPKVGTFWSARLLSKGRKSADALHVRVNLEKDTSKHESEKGDNNIDLATPLKDNESPTSDNGVVADTEVRVKTSFVPSSSLVQSPLKDRNAPPSESAGKVILALTSPLMQDTPSSASGTPSPSGQVISLAGKDFLVDPELQPFLNLPPDQSPTPAIQNSSLPIPTSPATAQPAEGISTVTSPPITPGEIPLPVPAPANNPSSEAPISIPDPRDLEGATSSEDTPKEDDTTTIEQMIVSCTISAPDEPTSHLPTIRPFAEGSNRAPEEGAPNRSSKQDGRSETSHVGGSELPLEVSRSQCADVILKVGLDHLEPPMVEVNMERVREPHEDMAAHGGGHSLEGSNNEASVSIQMHLEKLGSIKESVVGHADKRLPNAPIVEQHGVTLDDVDRGPSIPPQVHPDVEEELRFLDLSADCVAVLGPFLTSHPTMRLNKSRLFCRSAYECLWRFLLFVGSHPLSALLGDRRGDFTGFMDALTDFSFDPAWLDNLRVRVILPSDDSPCRALERILLRKQQISAEIENLRLEMESLEQQESPLRSLLDAPLLRL